MDPEILDIAAGRRAERERERLVTMQCLLMRE
jgi:hypothetical protein